MSGVFLTYLIGGHLRAETAAPHDRALLRIDASQYQRVCGVVICKVVAAAVADRLLGMVAFGSCASFGKNNRKGVVNSIDGRAEGYGTRGLALQLPYAGQICRSQLGNLRFIDRQSFCDQLCIGVEAEVVRFSVGIVGLIAAVTAAALHIKAIFGIDDRAHIRRHGMGLRRIIVCACRINNAGQTCQQGGNQQQHRKTFLHDGPSFR